MRSRVDSGTTDTGRKSDEILQDVCIYRELGILEVLLMSTEKPFAVCLAYDVRYANGVASLFGKMNATRILNLRRVIWKAMLMSVSFSASGFERFCRDGVDEGNKFATV